MFGTRFARVISFNHSARSGDITGIYFDFLSLKVGCVFSLGGSNECTPYAIFNNKNKKKITVTVFTVIIQNLQLLDFF